MPFENESKGSIRAIVVDSRMETLLFAFLHVIIKFTNVVLWKMKRMSLREAAHAGVAIRSPFRTGYVIGT